MTTTTAKSESLLLTAPQVSELLGISTRHLWRMADSGQFPRPISLGLKLKRWSRSVVERWLAEQSANVATRR